MEEIDWKRYPILFVDDEEENLEIFTINFRDQFTIHTANSGPQGLEILAREFVALVLSDQRMAGMTGMEFLEEVRKRHPELVLMLVTAYSDLDVVAEGGVGGLLYSYVLKPWEVKDFKTSLRRGIEHYYLVSERDRLHGEQIETMKKMARANRLSAVGTLAAGVAHEIRNPLVSIQTFLEMVPQKLSELPLSDAAQLDMEFWGKFYSLSYSEIQRIRTLISELVNFARSSPPKVSEVDLDQVIRAMVSLTRKQAENRGIKIHYEAAEGLPRVVLDESKIKQVFLNLILNAFQSMGPGGEVHILARSVDRPQQGAMLEVVVRDSGSGISEKIQEQVFDPFFTTKDPGDGVGLGLTICHQIMEEHGFEMEIRNRPEKGTEVILYFGSRKGEGGGETRE